MLRLPGRQFTVGTQPAAISIIHRCGSVVLAADVHYLAKPCQDFLRKASDTVVDIHTKEPPGDILVFLPGQEEIEKVSDYIQEALPRGAEELIIRPLYGGLPWDDQIKAIAPSRVNKVRAAGHGVAAALPHPSSARTLVWPKNKKSCSCH